MADGQRNDPHFVRQLVDLLGAATFLLARDGRVHLANRLAWELVDRRRGLTLQHGTLVADWSDETDRVRQAFRRLSQPPHQAVLAVARQACRQPLSLRLVRLGAVQAHCAMLVTDPTADASIDHIELQDWYGLTQREAQVAAALGDGLSVGEVADRLGITRGTTTTHMKHIYSKLSINSQAQLVHLLCRLPRSPASATQPVAVSVCM